MCGFSGIFSFKKNIEEHEISVTKKMTDAISHRGPDDCQYYNDKDCSSPLFLTF